MTLWFILWQANGINTIPWWYQMWTPSEIQNIRDLSMLFDLVFVCCVVNIGLALRV